MKYRKDNNRAQYLGASEAPAILGLSTWATPFDVWARKTQPQEESEGNSATRRGHILEGAVLNWGFQEIGRCGDRGGDFNSLPVQGPRAFSAFHPDGWVSNDCAPYSGYEYLVEVKTARDGDGWEDGGIPAAYAAQVRYQLACCPPEVEGAYVFAYITFKDEFLWRYVERDPAQEKAMLDVCEAWWNKHVVANVPPAFDGSEGGDAYLLNKHPKGNGLLEEATDAEALTVNELLAVRAQLKSLKAQDKRLAQILKDEIGDREGVFVAELGKAKWSWQKGRAGFDKKRFEADHPELFAEYATVGKEMRVLRLPKVK